MFPYAMFQIIGFLATFISLRTAQIFGKFYFTKSMGRAMSQDRELENQKMYQKVFGKVFASFLGSLGISIGLLISFPLVVTYRVTWSSFFSTDMTKGYVHNPELILILLLVSTLGLMAYVSARCHWMAEKMPFLE
jgi:hypothetical protein